MSYLLFDLLLVALPALILLWGATAARRRALIGPVAVLAGVALLWTWPWDEHLVRTGVWSYGPDRVLATVGSIPAEELLLVLLEVVLVAAWAARSGAFPDRDAATSGGSRVLGCLSWLAVGVVGVGLLLVGGQLRYLGLLLVWAAPPMALQAAVAGDILRTHRRARLLTAAPVALWLCAADRLALADGIWSIAPGSSTGLFLLGLPVEEAAFFALTAWLVTDGLLLATSAVALARTGIRSRPWRSTARSSISSATPLWYASTASPRALPPRSSRRSSTSTPVARSRTASR